MSDFLTFAEPARSYRTLWLLIPGLILILLVSSCEKNPTEVEEYIREPVLSAFIHNGKRVDYIFLDRVASLDAVYHPDDWFIFGADVKMFPVDNPAAGDTIHFREYYRFVEGWVYTPDPGNHLYPQAFVRYRIEARKPDENIYLWAETMMPDTFSITVTNHEVINDTIWIPLDWNDPPLELIWTKADSAGGYVLRTMCQNIDPLTQNVLPCIPLDPNYEIGEEPDLQYLEVVGRSARSVTVPWLAVNYTDHNLIEIQATSLDYIEYLESLFNFQESNPISNVHGGRGVFAGFSTDHIILTMQSVK